MRWDLKKNGSGRAAALIAAVTIAAALIGGCAGLLPEPERPARSFDFGPLPQHDATPEPRAVRLVEVTAPSWLDGRDIHYRRLDEQPAALNAYARSQWIASPSDLLAHRLRHRLSGAWANGREALLRVKLNSFEQVFETPERARVRIAAVATLDAGDARPLRRAFLIERESPPDVRGATRELPAAADELIEQIERWLAGSESGE